MREFYKIIINQLGGKRFIVMTGAKQFAFSDNTKCLTFKIGGGATGGINYVKITLTPADLYDMEFYKVRGIDLKTVEKFEGVYGEDLQRLFTEATGFDTRI